MEREKADVAASFQETALRDVALRAKEAAREFGCRAIYVGGGVSHNQRLRELLGYHTQEDFVNLDFARQSQADVPVFFPGKGLSTDNGAMLAGLAYHLFDGKEDPLDLEPKARIHFPIYTISEK